MENSECMMKLAQHYAKLEINPGWVHHARYMVKEYEKNPIWAGLRKCVDEQIELLKKQQSTGK
jgi:hypothetical protein